MRPVGEKRRKMELNRGESGWGRSGARGARGAAAKRRRWAEGWRERGEEVGYGESEERGERGEGGEGRRGPAPGSAKAIRKELEKSQMIHKENVPAAP